MLEDLHWADAPTRELPARLVQSSARARLLLLVTHRTTAPDRNDEFTYVMADLYRLDGVTRIDLGGLETEDVTDYLVREARMRRSVALSSAAVLRDQTAGNPFFLRELWRDLADAGGVEALHSASFHAPTSVRDTPQRRLANLPDMHAEVIELAAVAGAAFDVALSFSGAERAALEVGDRALELAQRIGDEQLVGHALCGQLWRGMTLELAPAQLDHALELVELGTRLGDLELIVPAAFFRSVLGYMQGLPDEWIAGNNDLVRAARSGGQPFYRYMAACCEYGRRFARGELAAAGRTAAALDEIGSEFGPDATEGSYGMQMFMLQRANRDLEQVRSLIDGSEDTEDHWAPGLLALYTELDMREPAARVLGDLLRRLDIYRQASAQWASVLVFMTDAAVLLDDVDAAARLRPLAAPYSGHNLVAGQFVATFGSADRSIGQLDSVLGTDTADDHFERALDMDRRMGATLHQVEALGAWCRHAERRGGAADRRRAAHLRAEATVLAERVGQKRVLWDLGVASRMRGADRALPDGLTEREVDVLRLVADGLSNREIGDRLFISQNTAANHVRSILMKIGASNRTRAAIYAVDHGLLDDGALHRVPTHQTSPAAWPLQR